jgi:hypothetical protein
MFLRSSRDPKTLDLGTRRPGRGAVEFELTGRGAFGGRASGRGLMGYGPEGE